MFPAFAVAALAQDCDRGCLEQHLDAYMDAVVGNNPDGGHLFVGFRQTENSIVVSYNFV